MAFTFPSTWKLRPKASAVETVTEGINEETVMLQSTLIAGGIDTIRYINQSRSATEHSPTQGNLILPSPELLQSTRLSTAAAADQSASIDSELRHAADM